MTRHRLAFLSGIIAIIVCTTRGQRIVQSSDMVSPRDGSNTATTNIDILSTMENMDTPTVTTNIDMLSTMENMDTPTVTTSKDIITTMESTDTPTDKIMTIKEPVVKNQSCLAVEIVSCECSPVYEVNSGLFVNCSNRNFSHVPENIPTNTIILILSGNKIENITADVFKNLSSLKHMDLSGNEIAIFEVGIFSGLNRLETLYLHDNPFNLVPSDFDDDLFSPLKNLRELSLKSRNPDMHDTFNYPDTALGKLTSLQTLIIDGLNNRTFGEGFHNMRSLRTMDLSNSPLFESISKDTFRSFQNISVHNLLLNKCSLKWIHPEALQCFPQIDTIDYSCNTKLEIAGVGKSFYGLQNTTVRKIIMRYVHSSNWFTSIDREDIIYLFNTKVEELYVDHNTIVSFTHDALAHFPRSIKILSGSWNIIQTTQQQILQLFRYRNLTEVIVSYQETYSDTYINNKETRKRTSDLTHTNQLSSTNTDNNGLPNITDFSTGLDIFTFDHIKGYAINFPPKLWNIQCRKTYKLKFVLKQITLINASVTHADFSYNLLSRWEGPILGVEKLLHLNLSGNDCDYISPQFFGFVPNLQTLRIDNNRFGPELMDNIFNNLTSLKILDMHRNLQENTRPALFTRLVHLQELDMSYNYLTSWNASISSLLHLSRLNLSNNKFITLPQNIRDDLDVISRHHPIAVDISGNRLICNCVTKDFVLWLSQTKVTFANLISSLCTLENGTELSLTRSHYIHEYLQHDCRSYTISITVSSVCVGLSLILLISFIIYRNRWKIRYLLYVTLNRKERTGYQRLEGNLEESQYFFNAFISYEDGSRPFILDQVIPRLETQFGLKLCIDKRDFVPGLFVTDNIMNAISNSRKTVVLLTKEFIKSKWCMYELNMARMEGLYNGRQTLIVVLLEGIPTETLPREILHLFRQQTYIEMVDDEYGAQLFWDRLRDAINMDSL